MRFGDYLRHLLAREAIAPIDLAAHLDVDISLVYRWLRHERVPGPNANHTARIADYLDLDPADRAGLRAAQHHSLGLARRQRPATPTDAPPPPPAPGDNDGAPPVPRPPAGLPRAVAGRPHVVEALVAFLRHLPPPVPPHDRLVLTTHGVDAAAHDEGLKLAWRQALHDALAAGWIVEHHLRLAADPARNARLAADLLALLGAHGRYRPHALPGGTAPGPPLDIILGPPAVGALLLLATDQADQTDAALRLQHPGQVALLRAHLRQLARASRPLTRSFPRDSRAEYWRTLTEIEERPGARGQLKEGLSVLTRPPAWYAEDATWWRAHGHTAASAALWRRRAAAFARHVRPGRRGQRHRDILPQAALERYVATGIHPADLRADGQGLPDLPRERLAHLDRILTLLRSDHYELALVRDGGASFPAETFWEVKTAQAALLQAYGRGEDGRLEYLIDEPELVAGFVATFDAQWERLAPYERDKATVRGVLEMKRDTLRRTIRRAAAPR